MTRTAEIIRGTLIVLVFVGLLGWWMYRSLRRSEEPVGLIVKWVITALMLPALMLAGGAGAYGVIFALIIGLVLAITWATSIAGAVARPFENLFTGGDVPPDPQPFYSIAQAKRKKGQYQEAVFEIHRQLEKFPTDLMGQVLMAEIQAENLNDLSGAQLTIERLANQPGHAPASIALAFNQVADWHLKFGQDIASARLALEKIIELLPGTEAAQLAAHRIAHIGTTEGLLASHGREGVRVR